jgi:AcrR family transcriptional regulator
VSPVSEARAGPKRSLLAQGRSRDTRQAIIKAALQLWGERGYDTGIDDTTAEEIAARAGVAKATFYFHFARKDDILLETGWLTAKVFYEDALKALLRGGSADDVIDEVTVKLCGSRCAACWRRSSSQTLPTGRAPGRIRIISASGAALP